MSRNLAAPALSPSRPLSLLGLASRQNRKLYCSLTLSMRAEGTEDAALFDVTALAPERGSDAIRSFVLSKLDVGGACDGPHIVSLTPDGPECTCRNFAHRRLNGGPAGCKHIVALRTFSLI